jgi:putative ABC transport system ATP-binding protein
MILLSNLKHVYNPQITLKFQDLEIVNGEHCLILGDSGSGKTTFLHILTGLLKPTYGKVSINNQDLYQLKGNSLDQFRAKNIGIVFQRPYLINSLTVLENLLVAQSFAGFKENKDEVKTCLDSLGILNKSEIYPQELSQGQLQRVSIARALINKPHILIADEPTSSLDDKNTAIVLDLLIHQAQSQNASLIIATHDARVKNRFSKTYKIS